MAEHRRLVVAVRTWDRKRLDAAWSTHAGYACARLLVADRWCVAESRWNAVNRRLVGGEYS